MGRKKGSTGPKQTEADKLKKKEAALLRWELDRKVKSGELSKEEANEIKELRNKTNKLLKEEQVSIVCSSCGNNFLCKRKNSKRRKLCDPCVSDFRSLKMKKYVNSLTPEEKRAQFEYALSCMTTTPKERVERSWKTIKSDPKLYADLCERRSKLRKEDWKKYSPETRAKIIDMLLGKRPIVRSKLSENFKQLMIKCGIYDGFESEKVFHGFIPDEINHTLKIIIEVNGTHYHCDPRVYKNPDGFVPRIKQTAAEKWQADKRKIVAYRSRGYVPITVWELDIESDQLSEIGRIKNEIDKQKKTLGIV